MHSDLKTADISLEYQHLTQKQYQGVQPDFASTQHKFLSYSVEKYKRAWSLLVLLSLTLWPSGSVKATEIGITW